MFFYPFNNDKSAALSPHAQPKHTVDRFEGVAQKGRNSKEQSSLEANSSLTGQENDSLL
jgi:hypothetical protein